MKFINKDELPLVIEPKDPSMTKEDIMARYLDRDIATLVSGVQGQISIKFNSTDYQISTYRHDMAPFWYNRLFRFGQIVKAE